MKPRLFIHIGTHKTGSTAIQRAFLHGAEGLVRLCYKENILKPTWDAEDAKNLSAQLLYQVRPCKAQRYLLSNEGFSGDPLDGYADAAVMAKRVRDVTGGFVPTIVVFLRRQDDFIESMYTQKIHEGGAQSFPEFMEVMHADKLNWHRLLEAYAAEFGKDNMVVRRYHADFYPKPESLLIDFCEIVGVSPTDVMEKKALPCPIVAIQEMHLRWRGCAIRSWMQVVRSIFVRSCKR